MLGGPDCMAEIRAEWQDLAKNSPTATPFQTWEWQDTWLRYYRRTKKPHLVAIRDGSDLVGLMPMTRTAPIQYLRPRNRSAYVALPEITRSTQEWDPGRTRRVSG